MSILQAPYATSSNNPNELYGHVTGSTPNWTKSNLHDGGRAHVASSSRAELGGAGFQGWNLAEAPAARNGIRIASHGQAGTAHAIAEPTVVGGHASYYARRALQDDSTGFRRSTRALPQVERRERPSGKRAIPEPYGPSARPHGVQIPPDDVRFREVGRAPEPGLPRLARPVGITGLRETFDQIPSAGPLHNPLHCNIRSLSSLSLRRHDMVISFERTIGRKARVEQDTYRGTGLAGDTLTPGTGVPYRPEDDPSFFRTLKDSPTFLRFCSTLAPPPQVSAHGRRAASLRRQQLAELSAEQQLVAALTPPDAGDE